MAWKSEAMKNTKQIKIGAILSYLSLALNIIAGLIYTPWMIGKIGQNQFGLYTLANSLITLFLIDFGLSSATARYLSKYNAEGNREDAETFLGAIYKLYIIVDVVILIAFTIIFFLIDTIYVNLTQVELAQFKVVFVISAVFSVISFPLITFNGILTAYEKFIQLKLTDVLYRIFVIAFTVIALLLGYGLYAMVTVHATTGLLILIIKYLIIKKSITLKVNFHWNNKKIYKNILSFSFWVTISAIAQRLVFNITPTVLGIVANTASIAIFGVVTIIEGYTYTIATAINGMFMPKISRIIVKNNANDNLMNLLFSVGKFQFALNGLIITGFAILGKSFIYLWMGKEYSLAYYGILLVLIPGLFYNALQIANTTLVVKNKVNIQAYVSIGTGVINLIMTFPLSILYGVIGACISIGISYSIRAIAMNVICNKVLGIDILLFIRKCYLRLSVPIIITVGIGFIMNHFIQDGGWVMLLIKSLAVTGIYCLLTFYCGLEKKDRVRLLQK